MKLSEVVNIAKYSELNTLAVKDNTAAIVSFINLGLVELYGIFSLMTEEYIIDLVDGVTIYDLPSDFMFLTGAYEAPPLNSPSDMIPLPVNEEGNPLSINTVNFKQVQVPTSVEGAYISIIYVPKPKVMSPDNLEEELPLPEQLLQPLLNFVAFKGHGAIRLDGQGEGDEYYRRFKRSCDDVKLRGIGIASDDLSMVDRTTYRGFP